MRMLQIRGGLDLGKEPLGPYHRSQLRLQDLQRDLPFVAQTLDEIDRSHPACASPLPPLVRHHLPQLLEEVLDERSDFATQRDPNCRERENPEHP